MKTRREKEALVDESYCKRYTRCAWKQATTLACAEPTRDPRASCCEISRTITHNHMQSIRESGLIWATRSRADPTPLFLPFTRKLSNTKVSRSEKTRDRYMRARRYEPQKPTYRSVARLSCFAEAIKNFKRFFCTRTFNLYVSRCRVHMQPSVNVCAIHALSCAYFLPTRSQPESRIRRGPRHSVTNRYRHCRWITGFNGL